MSYRMICLIKQVPDPSHITSDVLREDGTINREALPTIVNPYDLFALEMALGIKDKYRGKITVFTMGPPMAVDVLKDALSRGADDALILTDKRFAGSDTLATSQVLAWAIKKIGKFDLIFCGRQSIDGDTAQVGPQVAEKLNIPQVTMTESLEYLKGKDIVIRKSVDNGYERIRGTLPLLVTVTNTPENPRPYSAKRLMFWKKGKIDYGIKSEDERKALAIKGLLIPAWNFEKLDCPEKICGLVGSPTQIKQVESVRLPPRNHRYFDTSDQGIKDLMHKLISERII